MAFAVDPTVQSPLNAGSVGARAASVAQRPGSFEASLVALAPSLRAYARALCRQFSLADDLVQETYLAALANASQFIPGTSMRAWLFTILRNRFFSRLRRSRREVEDLDGSLVGALSTRPAQDHDIDVQDVKRALALLPSAQRDALLMVGALGYSYEEAAERCNCTVGTIKSRTHRARVRLAELTT